MKENVAVTTAGLGASVTCPGNTKVNVNVSINGGHSYSITNSSGDDISVILVCELKDSDGHVFSSNDPITVGAGETKSGDQTSFLNAAYSTTGTKTVTATTTLQGALSQSKSGTCSFQVSP